MHTSSYDRLELVGNVSEDSFNSKYSLFLWQNEFNFEFYVPHPRLSAITPYPLWHSHVPVLAFRDACGGHRSPAEFVFLPIKYTKQINYSERFDANHSRIALPHCVELLGSINLSVPHEQTYLSFRSWHVSGSGHRPFSRLARYCELIRVQEPYSSTLLSHSGSISTNYI